MTYISFLLVLVGVLLNAVAQLLLKAGVHDEGEIALRWDGMLAAGSRLAIDPHILGGVLCYVVNLVIWILALSRTDVSIAYPMLSLGYIVNAFGAWVLFGEALTPAKLLGIGIIIFGVFVLARS